MVRLGPGVAGVYHVKLIWVGIVILINNFYTSFFNHHISNSESWLVVQVCALVFFDTLDMAVLMIVFPLGN